MEWEMRLSCHVKKPTNLLSLDLNSNDDATDINDPKDFMDSFYKLEVR